MKIFDTTIKNLNPQIESEYYPSDWDSTEKYEKFKSFLMHNVNTNSCLSFYKFSDGEYCWLMNNQIGSVSPGKRDSNATHRNLEPFRDGIIKNDYLMCQLLKTHVEWFNNYFKKPFDYPVDYVYALVANKWFTKTFNKKIGLIGAGPKLDLINKLCEKNEYKNYLEFDGFVDYIKMPQKFLCDNIDQAEKIMADQLINSKSDIFLVGIGHAQQALLHRMKKYKKATYIVVGSGIDAYAGVQDNLRPYMGGWINFQLKDYDYTKIDIWRERFINKKLI